MKRCNILRWHHSPRLYQSGPGGKTLPEPPSLKEFQARGKDYLYSDYVRIACEAGRGGSGCVAFMPSRNFLGPPCGGNGGAGGSILIRATEEFESLHHLKSKFKAQDGKPGQGAYCHGEAGFDLYLPVPLGTRVVQLEAPTQRLLETQEEKYRLYAGWEDRGEIDQWEVLMQKKARKFRRKPSTLVLNEEESLLDVELNLSGQTVLVAQGGLGGKGNPHFKSSAMSWPKFCEYGGYGQAVMLALELKTLAQVGMVGLPNAGKSTLLKGLTRARPKIADYPFTTLSPNLGVFNSTTENAAAVNEVNGRRILMADIPGLVPGAHLNKGLGHAFLRHVEKTKVLVVVLDLVCPLTDPVTALNVLISELEAYDSSHLTKSSQKELIIVGNKADAPGSKERYQQLHAEISEKWGEGFAKKRLIPISAKEGKNLHLLEQLIVECTTIINGV